MDAWKIGCQTRMTLFDDISEVLVTLQRIGGVRRSILDIDIVSDEYTIPYDN